MVDQKKIENKAEEKEVKAEKKPVKFKLDLDKIVSKVQSGFGKDKSSASKISTGTEIWRPTKDEDFIVWRNQDGSKSPFESLSGIRGIPFNYVVSIEGRPNSGKSTHALQFMSLAQQQDCVVLLADTEGKFSADRFDNHFGGKSDQLLITTSKMILEIGDHIERMIHAIFEQNPDQKVLIVWDSVGGSLPKNESESSLDASKQLAAGAKENGAVLRGIIRLMEKYQDKESNQAKIALLLINQSYSNIGSVGQKGAGGQKVEFHSGLIIQLTRKADITKTVKGVKMKTGIRTRAKVSKNHLFSGDMSVSELDLIIDAKSISLASDKKSEEVDEDEVSDG